jgi:hypothetical protein
MIEERKTSPLRGRRSESNHFMHEEIISKLGARERRSRTQGKQIREKGRKEGK